MRDIDQEIEILRESMRIELQLYLKGRMRALNNPNAKDIEVLRRSNDSHLKIIESLHKQVKKLEDIKGNMEETKP